MRGLTLGDPALLAVTKPGFLFQDNFNRPNQTGFGTATSGQTWTTVSGSPQILNNEGYALLSTMSTVSSIAADFDATVKVRLGSPNGNPGFVFRFANISNYWSYSVDNTRTCVYRRVAGSYSLRHLGTGNSFAGTTVTLRVVALGSLLTFYANGTQVFQTTDSNMSTATTIGTDSALLSSNASCFWDDMVIT